MLKPLLRTMRPHQWVKNLFVVAPLVFAKELLDLQMALRTCLAALLFCLTSSAVYILNDLADVKADRAHPVKRHRPIASGALSRRAAATSGVVLTSVVLAGSTWLGGDFARTILAYLLLSLAYTSVLKRYAYVDVFAIAMGFELRVLAGAEAAGVPASLYLCGVTLFLALFLGFGKRLHELLQGETTHKQRFVLRAYKPPILRAWLYLAGIATFATYLMYSLDPHTQQELGTPYFVLTSGFALFGLWRFVYLTTHFPDAESPTDKMLRDPPFLANLGLWAASVLVVIYAR